MSPLNFMLNPDVQQLRMHLREEMTRSRIRALAKVEEERKTLYWRMGRSIKAHLIKYANRHGYGDQLFSFLSKELELDQSLVYRVVKFYEQYPEGVAACKGLTWTHICFLLTVKDPEERQSYETKVAAEKLKTRDLRHLLKTRKKARLTGKLKTRREAPYTYRMKDILGISHVDLGFNIYIEKPDRPVSVAQKTHYVYKASLLDIVDGDTLKVSIDLGFYMKTIQRVRLRGVDTAPKASSEGAAAIDFLKSRLESLPFIVLRTYWPDKYDRYLVDVFYDDTPSVLREMGDYQSDFFTVAQDGRFLNQEIIDRGFGQLYS